MIVAEVSISPLRAGTSLGPFVRAAGDERISIAL